MGRRPGRITREDLAEAGFRRWDGKQRITTDWTNIFSEPELQWPNGDILVYLREPGQSSRGPSFRVHSSRLRAKGFTALLDCCMQCSPLPPSSALCEARDCTGRTTQVPAKELYIPAPAQCELDDMLDFHATTRNFFAWLYKLPLAGRALGPSLTALKARLDHYRSGTEEKNTRDLIAFAETQRYLDFRECVDHALAALHFAENLQIQDLWIDAFAHCVGLSQRGMRESIEFGPVSGTSKLLINKARLELDATTTKVSRSIATFFENDLAGVSLSPTGRDHLDRYRSFLHSFYIEQHGFWPPDRFEDEDVQRSLCNTMYSDFRNLYHHLADEKAPNQIRELDVATGGGTCVLQNIHALDVEHKFHPLPQFLPMLPSVDVTEPTLKSSKSQRRNSWNPMLKRRLDREERNARRVQALIDASNRDWTLMNCPLVRRFSDFEAESAVDELEPIALAEGRKVRWIATYTVLQILISVVEAPKQVRNIEGLSYTLCCKAPNILPWQKVAPEPKTIMKQELGPDVAYSHTNTTNHSLTRTLSRIPTTKSVSRPNSRERRKTLSIETPPNSAPSSLRSKSLRRLISRKTSLAAPDLPIKRASFTEIYIPGYGNGLNDVEIASMPAFGPPNQAPTAADARTRDEADQHVPKLPDGNSVSREVSNASTTSTRSTASTQSEEELPTPVNTDMRGLGGFRIHTFEQPTKPRPRAEDEIKSRSVHIVDQDTGLDTVHFNTQTWDAILRV